MMTQTTTFHADVETLFIGLRGKAGCQIPPLDWPIVQGWFDSNVPFDLIESVMRRAFGKNPDIGSIRYFQKPIEDEMRRRAAFNVGGRGGSRNGGSHRPADETPETDHRARVVRFLESARDELENVHGRTDSSDLQECVLTAWWSLSNVLDDIRSTPSPDFEAVEKRMSELEEKLVTAATSALSASQLVSLREACEKLLKSHRSRMEADVYQECFDRHVRAGVLQHFGVPRLSLFYMG